MWIVNLVSNFLNLAEPCNEVETFTERWQLICAVEKSHSILRDLYFDTGQSLTPPHSGGRFQYAQIHHHE